MIFSAFAILVVLLSGYVWMLRGFFSALLHLVCTVAAGAIAFGFWEVLANLLLDQGGALENSAWGIGLALPFALSLIPIRIVFDKLIPANVKLIPPPTTPADLSAEVLRASSLLESSPRRLDSFVSIPSSSATAPLSTTEQATSCAPVECCSRSIGSLHACTDLRRCTRSAPTRLWQCCTPISKRLVRHRE